MWIFGLKHGIEKMLEVVVGQVITALGDASSALHRQTTVVDEHGKYVNTVFEELKKQTAALAEQIAAMKRQDEKTAKVLDLLVNLEKRMNAYSFSAIECQNLVGELRAVRYLLDEKGQYKSLDKNPAVKRGDSGGSSDS